MGKAEENADRLTKTLMVIYWIVLGWIILFKLGVQFSYMEERRINLVPFANGYFTMMETVMNVVIFIPMGMYAGALYRSRFFVTSLLFFFLMSLMLEGLQYAFKLGAFDITDLLTNTTGGMVGYLLFLGFRQFFTNPLRAHKILNNLGTIATLLMVSLLVLLKLDMLPIRYQ
ncbi:VanZ family protein [Algoriphagus sp.]|uniref:VanZ family protein n=1 Tax=Algoriphagus sp. TaxID=1872435 RepID=UPI003F7226FA